MSAGSTPSETIAGDAPLSAGQSVRYFGDYEILGEIARGAMGVVYRARQISLNRLVALKTIQAGRLAVSESVQRFHIEAEAAAQLDHPRIVPVYEIGEHDGCHFLSMRLLEGGTLRDRIGELSSRPAEAVKLVEEIARAVHFAHQRGVLHRDLKPANILLDAELRPYVADFGLARLQQEGCTITQSGAVIGTPSYMSPEQAAGKTSLISSSCDVYGLGAILYHLLTGHPPFQADSSMATLRKVLDEEPVPPRRINPVLDRDLATIVLKCLEKKPTRRYGSAEALADDLALWRAGRPVNAREIGMAERIYKWCRRRPLHATLVGTLTSAAVVMAVGFVHFTFRLQQEKDAAVVARQSANRERRNAETAEWQARDAQYAALIGQATAEYVGHSEGRRHRMLEALHKAAAIRPSRELDRLAADALVLEDFRVVSRWPTASESEPIVFSHTGAMTAGRSDDGRLHVTRMDRTNATDLVLGDADPVAFSPDDHWLVAVKRGAQGDELRLFNLDAPAQPMFTGRAKARENSVKFSMAADRLYFISATDELMELTLSSLALRTVGATGFRFVYELCPLPGGGEIAVSDEYSKDVVIFSTRTGVELARLHHEAEVRPVTVRASDGLLACGAFDNMIYLWAPPYGKSRAVTFMGHKNTPYAMTFSGAGRYLVSRSWDWDTLVWDVEAGEVVARSDKRLAMGLDPAGKVVGFREAGACGLMRLAPGETCRALPVKTELPVGKNFKSVDISPDASRIAASSDHGIYVWNIHSNTAAVTFPLKWDWAVKFEADSRHLLVARFYGLARVDTDFVEPVQHIATNGIFDHISVDASRRKAAVHQGLSQMGRLWTYDADTRDFRATDFKMPDVYRPARQTGFGYAATTGAFDLFAICMSEGERLGIFNPGESRAIAQIPVRGTSQAEFTPDGRWLVVADGFELSIWSSADWSCVFRMDRKSPDRICSPLAVRPDGKMFAATIGRRGPLALIEIPSGRMALAVDLPEPRSVNALAFSADGRQLAVACDNMLMQLWQMDDLMRQVRAEGFQ